MSRLTTAILFVFILAAGFTKATAQGRGYFREEGRVFYGGLVAGMNFSTVNGDSYDGFHKIGFNGGGVVYIRFVPKFLGNVEILYNQKGSRGVKTYDSYYSGTFAERYFLDLNYIEIPLLLHYELTDKWTIGIGASYGQLLNSKEDLVTDQPVNINPETHQFRKQDYCGIGNATLQFGKGIFLNLRYQQSLATIRDADKVPIGYGAGIQTNSMFSLRLMYLIR